MLLRAVSKLLANERVSAGLQNLASSAIQAKAAVGRGVKRALHAANLPSSEDVEALRKKIDDLEALVDGLAEKIARGPRGE